MAKMTGKESSDLPVTTMLLILEFGLLRTLPESSSSDPLYKNKSNIRHL